MKKQIMLFIVALAFVLTLTGAVSAAETNTTSTQYQIGQQVTQQALADTTLNMKQSNKNLLITTANTATLNNKTTEDCAQAVIDKTSTLSNSQKISYGNGNLLVINDPSGPLWFTFISQTGTKLMAKTYTINENGKITTGKTVNIGTTQNSTSFKDAITKLGSNGYNTAAIANLWAAGAPSDLLKAAASYGEVNPVSINGYAMAKSFDQNYAPSTRKEKQIVIASPGSGGLDNMAYFGLLDVAPQKASGISFIAMDTGNPEYVVYMLYNSKVTPAAGTLVLLKYVNMQSTFTQTTGITVTSGTRSEIQYICWLLTKLKADPNALFTVEKSVKINQDNYNYLTTNGIDLNYINNLGSSNAAYNEVTYSQIAPDDSAYSTWKSIGEQAATSAINLLNFSKGDPDVCVVTSAGWAVVNGQSTAGALDGLVKVLGIPVKNIMAFKTPAWAPLWFAIAKKDASGALNTVFMQYINGALVQSHYPYNGVDQYVYNLKVGTPENPGLMENESYAKGSVVKFLEGGSDSPVPTYDKGYYQQDYYPVTLINQWAIGVPWNYLYEAVNDGSFACSAMCQRRLNAYNVLSNYPLGPNERYIVITPISVHDLAYMEVLNVSPGDVSYFTTGQRNSTVYPNNVGLFIRWNDQTQTGSLVALDFDQNTLYTMQGSIGTQNYWYRTVYYALWYYQHAISGKDMASQVQALYTTANLVLMQTIWKY